MYDFSYIRGNLAQKILYNVLGWRRFCSCDKGMRSIPATAKMWWSKMPQRAVSPTGVLRNPNRPKGGERQPFVKRWFCLF